MAIKSWVIYWVSMAPHAMPKAGRSVRGCRQRTMSCDTWRLPCTEISAENGWNIVRLCQIVSDCVRLCQIVMFIGHWWYWWARMAHSWCVVIVVIGYCTVDSCFLQPNSWLTAFAESSGGVPAHPKPQVKLGEESNQKQFHMHWCSGACSISEGDSW